MVFAVNLRNALFVKSLQVFINHGSAQRSLLDWNSPLFNTPHIGKYQPILTGVTQTLLQPS